MHFKIQESAKSQIREWTVASFLLRFNLINIGGFGILFQVMTEIRL